MTRDDENNRREQAAGLAALEADVRRIDDRHAAEHEYLESVSAKGQETARTVQEIEVQAERMAGRVAHLESAEHKGSERMATIEEKQEATDARLNWYAGALALGGFLAPFAAALIAKVLGW